MTVTLVRKYNPQWPDWFQRIRKTLLIELDETRISIEHVGSTSIPGMVAKPVIDLDIILQSWDDFDYVREQLDVIRYVHAGDKGVTGREVFTLEDIMLKSVLPGHHLYVCQQDEPELKKHLAFRDFLRSNAEYREQLSALKWQLCEEHDNDRQDYINGKASLTEKITNLALEQLQD